MGKGLARCTGSLGNAAAASAARLDARRGGARQAGEELGHGAADLGVEAGEERLLFGEEVALDAAVELAAGLGRREDEGPPVVRMGRALDVALPLQSVHHPARRALVEIEVG